MPEPAVVADQMPDLDALREAAMRAAALVHGSTPEPVSEAKPEDMRGQEAHLIAVDEVEQFTEATAAEESKRGRPKSSAAEERANRVLGLVTRSGEDGVTKAALVEATGESAPNVNTSLQRLKDEGKIDSKPVEGSKALAWFAV